MMAADCRSHSRGSALGRFRACWARKNHNNLDLGVGKRCQCGRGCGRGASDTHRGTNPPKFRWRESGGAGGVGVSVTP